MRPEDPDAKFLGVQKGDMADHARPALERTAIIEGLDCCRCDPTAETVRMAGRDTLVEEGENLAARVLYSHQVSEQCRLRV